MKEYRKMRLTKHHLWWPRRDYYTPLEIAFRNLDCNVVLLPDCIHQMLHKMQDPPEKPSREFMQEMVDLYTVQGVRPELIYNPDRKKRKKFSE